MSRLCRLQPLVRGQIGFPSIQMEIHPVHVTGKIRLMGFEKRVKGCVFQRGGFLFHGGYVVRPLQEGGLLPTGEAGAHAKQQRHPVSTFHGYPVFIPGNFAALGQANHPGAGANTPQGRVVEIGNSLHRVGPGIGLPAGAFRVHGQIVAAEENFVF